MSSTTMDTIRKVYAFAPIVTAANRMSDAVGAQNEARFDRVLAEHDALVRKYLIKDVLAVIMLHRVANMGVHDDSWWEGADSAERIIMTLFDA